MSFYFLFIGVIIWHNTQINYKYFFIKFDQIMHLRFFLHVQGKNTGQYY